MTRSRSPWSDNKRRFDKSKSVAWQAADNCVKELNKKLSEDLDYCRRVYRNRRSNKQNTLQLDDLKRFIFDHEYDDDSSDNDTRRDDFLGDGSISNNTILTTGELRPEDDNAHDKNDEPSKERQEKGVSLQRAGATLETLIDLVGSISSDDLQTQPEQTNKTLELHEDHELVHNQQNRDGFIDGEADNMLGCGFELSQKDIEEAGQPLLEIEFVSHSLSEESNEDGDDADDDDINEVFVTQLTPYQLAIQKPLSRNADDDVEPGDGKTGRGLESWKTFNRWRDFEVGKCYRSEKYKDTVFSLEKLQKRRVEKQDGTVMDKIMCCCHEVIRANKTIMLENHDPPFEYCCFDNQILLDLKEEICPLGEPFDECPSSPDWFFETTHSSGFAYRHRTFRRSNRVGHIDTPRVAEFFAGAGGMGIGFQRAGFEHCLAIDNNKDCCDTLRSNAKQGMGHILLQDARTFLDNGDMNIQGEVHHVHCSPPCQGFSRANRYGGKNDEENRKLSLLFPRALAKLSPLLGTYEMVTGILMQQHRGYLQQIVHRVLKLGYQIRCCILTASDYGDPQNRKRLFLFCSKVGLELPRKPPSYYESNPVTTREAIGFLEHLDGNTAEVRIDTKSQPKWIPNCLCSKKVMRDDDDDELYLPADTPACTIKASACPMHYNLKRRISPREAACLQSFPEDYRLTGNLTSQYSQAGNAVPIELATAVAQEVRRVLDHSPISLGFLRASDRENQKLDSG